MKRFFITFLSLILSVILILGDFSYAQNINFSVYVDKNKVSLGSPVTLSIQLDGAQDFSAPEIPHIDGVQTQYVGPLTKWSFINGVTSISITHNYMLLPTRVGIFEIPPITINYKGNNYTSNPIKIEVVKEQVVKEPTSVVQEGLNLEDRIFVVIQPQKNKIYEGEELPVVVKLYYSVGIRNVQLPELNSEGLMIDRFENPKQYQEQIGSIVYNVMEFKTKLSGFRNGIVKIGPAVIHCDLIVNRRPSQRSSLFEDLFSDDFFDSFLSRNDLYPLSLSSPQVQIEVMALPTDNVPKDFKGAIGSFNMQIEANPTHVNEGDPITLTLTISGRGNFKTVNLGTLNLGEDFKVYDPEVNQKEDQKEFKYVIIPKSSSVTKIPEISFSYFDVDKGTYENIKKGPIPIQVTKLPISQQTKIVAGTPKGLKEESITPVERLGQDIVYIKDSLGVLKRRGDYFYKSLFFKIFLVVPFLFLIAFVVFYKHQLKIKSDVKYARRLYAPAKAKKGLQQANMLLAKNDIEGFYKVIFKTIQEYIGDRFHIASGGITADVVDTVLKNRGLDEGILWRLRIFFRDCDQARYAPSTINKEQMFATFNIAREIIDMLERVKD